MARNSGENGSAKPPETASPAEGRDAQVRTILRRIYDDVIDEPVPDSFADLLRKLD